MINRGKNPNIDRVKKCLTGITYPASKEKLIQHAQNTCGDEGVVSMLKGLPDHNYGAANDLTGALNNILGRGIHLRLDI